MFLVNSRHPLVCAPRRGLRRRGARLSRSYAGNLPSSFNIVLSSALVCSTSPPVSVSGTVSLPGLFPGTPSPHPQSGKRIRHTAFVTTGRLGNVRPIPIDYGFRPRLRGRLTLRGLALRRNPWTFGERVSHPLCRYSCQHSRFRCLQRPSRGAFAGLRNAPLPRRRTDSRRRAGPPRDSGGSYPASVCSYSASVARSPPPAASAPGLSPDTSSARDGLIRPVSCYAFFKGWLLLSQPPGCFGLPTSFPT